MVFLFLSFLKWTWHSTCLLTTKTQESYYKAYITWLDNDLVLYQVHHINYINYINYINHINYINYRQTFYCVCSMIKSKNSEALVTPFVWQRTISLTLDWNSNNSVVREHLWKFCLAFERNLRKFFKKI